MKLQRNKQGQIICPVCKSGKGILEPYPISVENPHQYPKWCEHGRHLLIIQEPFEEIKCQVFEEEKNQTKVM